MSAGELRLSTVAGLVAAMGLATLGFYDPLPPWLPLPLAAIAAWRLSWPWRGRRTPRLPQAVKLGLLGVFGFCLWASGHVGLGLEGAGAVFIVLLWAKLFELHSPRDFHRTAAIALFVVAAQLLLSQTLGQCLFALVSSLMLLAVLAQSHIVGDEASGFTDARPWRTWLRAGRSAGVIVAQSLPFAGALFICLPRPPSPGFDRPIATSGVSDSLSPGSVAKVALSATPAFRVDFAAGAPPPAGCYWRGVVLWRTDGESWGRDHRVFESLPPPLAREPSAEAESAYEITLQPQNQRWIYTLDCPLAIDAPPATAGGYSGKLGCVYESAHAIVTTTVYRARSQPRAEARDDVDEVGYLFVKDHQRLLDADPRFTPLLAALRKQAAGRDGRFDPARDAQRAIDATLEWFRTQGFVYTLEPGEMGPNPTGTFLFERRRGFCEHYANAFGLLMRLLGVQSRVVVGYLGGEINSIGGFMTVRQANAHAWNEVWVGDSWRRVDATGEATALDAAGNPIPQSQQGDPAAFATGSSRNWLGRHLRWLTQRWDYLAAQWDRWALAYDSDMLAALERLLGLQGLGLFAPLLMLLGACLPLLGLLLLLMRRRRRAADPTVALYLSFCARLARAGVARAPAEGPLDLARRAAAALPDQGETIRRIAGGYAELRYGPPRPPQDRRAGISRLAREVRSFHPRAGSRSR